MVREFGFTQNQANSHTTTARSYLAVPLLSGEKLAGIIYLFSDEPQVFPTAAKSIVFDEFAVEITNYLKHATIIEVA
jgi:GAF domain-containing protein